MQKDEEEDGDSEEMMVRWLPDLAMTTIIG